MEVKEETLQKNPASNLISKPKKETSSDLFKELISSLALVLDFEENRKLYHAWRVAVVSARIAEEILPRRKAQIFYAGLLHDIGAMGIPDHLVHYPSLKDQLSVSWIRSHPQKGAQIIRNIPGLYYPADLVLDHHEWYDGQGYPGGKKGTEILQGAQILRIADAFDLRLGKRPKQPYLDLRQWLKKYSGREFSAYTAEALLVALNKDNFYSEIAEENHLSFLVRNTSKDLPEITLSPHTDIIGTILGLFAEVIDAKHTYTAGHSKRVSQYSVSLATAKDLSHDEITKIKWAGFLHDLGKVAVPRSILDKPAGLTKKELDVVKKHPVITMKILRQISQAKELAIIAGHHHEHYDGTGYPDGWAKEKIPLSARIMAVADALDGMTSPRPYQRIRTFREALRVIRAHAGTQFDPEIARIATLVFN